MQTTSALYNTILADPNHSFEVKLNIAGVDYGEDVLMAVSIKSKVFENTPIIGGTYASVLTFSMYSDGASIPRMAKVIPYYRAKNEAQTSEWLKNGEFYIDTREVSNNDNGLDVFSAYCYDSMLLANSEYGASSLTWPATDTAVVAEICTQLGLTQDARNAAVMTGGYSIPLPTAYTKRDVLGFIAVMYGANWIMTDEGKLRIVKLTAEGDAVNIGKSLVNLNVGPLQPAYTQVVLTASTDTAYTSGSTDTEVLEAYCPYATQAVTDAVKTAIGSWQYQPFDASGVWTDPALELGDKLTAVDKTGVIFSRDLNFGPSMVMDLSAPYQNDINHEYAFESPTERQYKAEVNGIKSEIRVMEGKIALVVDGDGVKAASIVAAINDSESTVIISADHINLQGYVTFTDLTTSGRTEINGANIITETITANKIDLTDLFSQNITATNFNIIGGSINIKTASATDDKIDLEYSVEDPHDPENPYYYYRVRLCPEFIQFNYSQTAYLPEEKSYSRITGKSISISDMTGGGVKGQTIIDYGKIRINGASVNGTNPPIVLASVGTPVSGIYEPSLRFRDSANNTDDRMTLQNSGLVFGDGSGSKTAEYANEVSQGEYMPSDTHTTPITFGTNSKIYVRKWGTTGYLRLHLNITNGDTWASGQDHYIYTLPSGFVPKTAHNVMVPNELGTSSCLVQILTTGEIVLFRYAGSAAWAATSRIRCEIPMDF